MNFTLHYHDMQCLVYTCALDSYGSALLLTFLLCNNRCRRTVAKLFLLTRRVGLIPRTISGSRRINYTVSNSATLNLCYVPPHTNTVLDKIGIYASSCTILSTSCMIPVSRRALRSAVPVSSAARRKRSSSRHNAQSFAPAARRSSRTASLECSSRRWSVCNTRRYCAAVCSRFVERHVCVKLSFKIESCSEECRYAPRTDLREHRPRQIGAASGSSPSSVRSARQHPATRRSDRGTR